MSKEAKFPSAGNDFYKTNGSDTTWFPVGPSLTRQEFAEECDINSIMRRYETTGATINGLSSAAAPMYADFTTMPTTLLDYMQMMQDAETAFMSLPAMVRKEFDNSAMAFVDFASDPENLEQMRTWGLAPPAAAPVGEPAASPGTAPQAAAEVPQAPAAALPAVSPITGRPRPTHGST